MFSSHGSGNQQGEVLEENRDILKEGSSIILTLAKSGSDEENRFRRINVRKVISLDEITKQSYTNVQIEIHNVDDLKKLFLNLRIA